MSDPDPIALVEITSEVVSAYLAQNHVPAADIPALIASVHATLTGLGVAPELDTAEPDRATPAVSIGKSVTDEYPISLEAGERLAALRRHLTGLGMTPASRRAEWDLPSGYPMVSPTCSRAQPASASQMGPGARLQRR